MTEELRSKLAKVYALVKRGATEGEQDAAKKAMDRIIEKYKIDPSDLDQIELKIYRFKYSTKLDFKLLERLMFIFTPGALLNCCYITFRVKEILAEMNYMDWVTLESSYEYYRRHMKEQWNKTCAKEVKRCRKTKTRNKRRLQLQEAFFKRYVIESKLYKESEISKLDTSKMSHKEIMDLMMLRGVEGGTYNKQMTNGLMIENL
jgi:predicted secreted protein